MPTFYYQWTGSPSLVSEIQRVADPAASLGPVTFPVAIDVTIASAGQKPALDVVMTHAGFVEVPLALDASWGKIVSVDSVLGNDTKGRRGGYPFLTITAALAVATGGDLVLIGPGTYTENSGITIPSGVMVSGRCVGTNAIACVLIQALAVTVATDLITMGEKSRLEHVTGKITSVSAVQIQGIVFPGATTESASVDNVTIVVDQTGASAAATQNAFGVHVTGTGQPPPGYECLTWNNSITVIGAGLGDKRGILNDALASMRVARTSILLTASDQAKGFYYGIETVTGSSIVSFRWGTIDGGVTANQGADVHADVAQTKGVIELGSTNLVHSNANGLGIFSVLQSEDAPVVWGDPGTLAATSTLFMQFGSGTANGTEQFIRLRRKCVVHALSVVAKSGPTGADTDTWTIRKNGVDTLLTLSLTGGGTVVANDTVSVSFADDDFLSLKVVTSGATTSTAPQLTVNCY